MHSFDVRFVTGTGAIFPLFPLLTLETAL